MARWESTHDIIRNFAYGNPVKQYRKGTQAYLSGDCLDFAALNRCAMKINPTFIEVEEVVIDTEASTEGADVE